MLNAFKLIWNFSSKRKKEYRNAIIFSFLEGLFLMAKMFAVIIAIYALFGRYPLSNAVIAVFALAVFYILLGLHFQLQDAAYIYVSRIRNGGR